MKTFHFKLLGFFLTINLLGLGCISYQKPLLDKLKDSNVEIVKKDTYLGVKLFAKLTNCSEATITLEAILSGMKSSPPLPITVDSKGRQYFEIAKLIPTTDGRWEYHYHYFWLPGRCSTIDSCSFLYSLPYKTESFKVAQGYKGTFSHKEGSNDEFAIDWKMPIGTEIYSTRGGIVVGFRMDSDTGGSDSIFVNSANYVIIMHDDGTFANYVHLMKNSVIVKLGQKVKEGELLALSGNTGHSTSPHLHLSIFHNVNGHFRKTIPVKFKTKTGEITELINGEYY